MKNLAVMIVALGMMFGCVLGSQAQDLALEIKNWDLTYEGNALPTGNSAWIKGDTIIEVKDGALHLADKGTGPDELVNYIYYWKAEPSKEATVEARVKVVFCSDVAASVYLSVSNSRFADFLTFYEDRIELKYAKLSYRMDTRDEFHTYRITMKDSDIKVYVDGKLRIDGSGKLTQPAYGGRNNTISFGSGTSIGTGEAYWDWLRYYVEKESGIKTEKGTVKVEKTQIIFESEEDINFPMAIRFKDGTIWVGFSNGEHTVSERPTKMMSTDNGSTWKSGDFPVWPMPITALSDGRVIRVYAWDAKPLRGTVYPVGVDLLNNHQSLKIERIKSEVELPWNCEFRLHRSLIRTTDGKLIATGYGAVKGEPRSRSYCIISDDEGKTWKFLSTIAYDPKIGSEGYCEPVLEQLSNGDLLCLLRTGSHFREIQPENHFPLMQTRSTDGGKTWEVPHEVADYGVDPDLKLLSSGILVATFGRPRGLLMVDFDGTGAEWDGVVPIYKGWGCFYTSILEIEPNLIMVIYTESNMFGTGGQGPLNRLMAAYIRLQRRQ